MKTIMTRTTTRRKAVTLTEVVVGASLLVLAIVPLLKALTIAQGTSTIIARKTQSLMLAQARLDELHARSICHYDSSFDEDSTALADSYLRTTIDDEDSTLRLVTVSVGHDADGNGTLAQSEVDVELATYLAKR